MEHKKTYRIGRLTYTQSELTWKKDMVLFELLKTGLGIADNDEDLTLLKLQGLLVKYNLMGEFLAIILDPKRDFFYYLFRVLSPFKKIHFETATNSTIGTIFEDFFFLNKTLLSRLTLFAEGWDLMKPVLQEMGKYTSTSKRETSRKSEKKETEPIGS